MVTDLGIGVSYMVRPVKRTAQWRFARLPLGNLRAGLGCVSHAAGQCHDTRECHGKTRGQSPGLVGDETTCDVLSAAATTTG